MARLKKILAPVDGSPASLEAHRLALDLAGAFGGEEILLYVVDSSVLAELSRLSGQERPRLLHDMQESGGKLLATLSGEAKKRGVAVRVEMHEGIPDEIIMREAERHRVELIVMGKMGRKGHRRSLLGSVTEWVLEASDLPVLVVSPVKVTPG